MNQLSFCFMNFNIGFFYFFIVPFFLCFCVTFTFIFAILILYEYLFIILAIWSSARMRKRFFDEFATREGFDPLVAENWYRYTLEQALENKVFKKSNFLSPFPSHFSFWFSPSFPLPSFPSSNPSPPPPPSLSLFYFVIF